jgi:iron complex outermembrane recepter protein
MRVLVASAIVLAASVLPAMADTTAIEVVTVTAERRVESAQNVGIALTVLSGADLLKRNVFNVNQLQYSTPSLEIVPAFGSGQPEFRLRGVGFDDYGSNNSSTVGIYVDEVAYPIPAQTQGLLFDISRVEILRGPQGTLYGRNTTGGAINFITNKPSDVLTAGLTADFDSHDEFHAEGYVSGPISDDLLFRLAATTDQGGAWQKNRETGQSLGDKDTSAVRGELQWNASSSLSFLLEGHFGYDDSEPTGLYLFDPIPNIYLSGQAVPAFSNTAQTGWGGSTTFGDLIGKPADVKPFHASTNGGVNLRATDDLGFATLTSITSFESLNRKEYNDWDASSLAYAGTLFNTRAHVYSQELRLASNDDTQLSWLIGFYFSHEDLNETFDSDFWQSLGFVTQTTYNQHVESEALFGQVTYHFTDKLALVGGLRGESEHREQKDYVTQGVFAPGTPPTPFSVPADKTLNNTNLSGKAELEYKPWDETLLYASISEGVKSGGFTSYNVPSASAVGAFKPETLWAYEAGFKTTFADDTVQLNGAGFYYDYHNQQVQSAIWSNFGAIGAIVNAHKSHVYGFEFEGKWNPVPELQLSQSLGWKDGQFDEYSNDLDIAATTALCVPASICVPPGNTLSPVFVNRKGARVGFAPWSYGGSGAYTFQLPGYSLEAEADYAFHDHFDPILLGPVYYVKSYWIANANLTLTPDNGPWSVALFGHNIFNANYDTTRNFFLTDINIAQRGEPATVGVRLSLKY